MAPVLATPLRRHHALAVSAVGSVPVEPVLTVLAAWEGPEAVAWAESWLPCHLMNVSHHGVIQKVVRQTESWGVGVYVHSTHAFAAAHPKAYGAQSSVSGVLAPEVREAAAEVRQPSK